IGSELEMELEVSNIGASPFMFEEALHTYLAVGDVREVSIAGLEHATFIDKTDGFQRKNQGGHPVRITKETDQVHLNTEATCTVSDPVWNRRVMVEKSGSNSTVIWNPWIEKTMAMADMSPNGWQGMVCVETANAADNAVTLLPGASHTL